MIRFQLFCASAIFGVVVVAVSIAEGQAVSAGGDAASLFEEAQVLASDNRLAEAENILGKAKTLSPADLDIDILLAKVKSRLGETSDACKLFKEVVSARPTSAEAHLDLAIALADGGNTAEALHETEVSIHLNNRSAKAHLNRARLLADLGRSAPARAEYLRAHQLAPGDPEVVFFWAVFEKDTRHPDAAAALFAKVVTQQPDNIRALMYLGQQQQILGQTEEAIVSWRQVIRLDPTSEEATYALSQALRSKNPEESGLLSQRFQTLHARRQNEEQVRELGNEAYSAMQQQEWGPAIKSLQRAVDLCGQCSLLADLHQRLGLAECHRGNLEIGERELRLALALNPNDRETVNALQWVGDHRK